MAQCLQGQGAACRGVHAFIQSLVSLTREHWLEVYHPFKEDVVEDT